MKSFFININENRLKAGWRILAFIIILMAISIAFQFILKGLLGGMPPKGLLRNFAVVCIASLAATIAVPIVMKFIHKRSYLSLGLNWNKKAFKDLIFGFGLSGLMAGTFLLILFQFDLAKNITINWTSNDEGTFQETLLIMNLGTLLFLLLMDTFVGWWEELAFRGILFQNMVEGFNLKIAIILSCLLYGVVHMANPNAGVLSSLIIVVFGYLRICGYLATKMLWLSIGMHIGWNFFQGPIFGFSASGHQSATLLSHELVGPTYLTGGEFGPEASLITVPIILLALLVMKWWAKKNKN